MVIDRSRLLIYMCDKILTPIERFYFQLRSGNIRYFCGECGSHLFAYDKQWAEWCYPYASAIDTDLPVPKPEDIHRLMLNKKSKCNWADTPPIDNKRNFSEYPNTSLEDWHKNNHQFIERK
jgi:hypothetical protein